MLLSLQSHPPPYSGTNGNGYDGSSYSGNGYNANGYLPASGPSYGAGRPPSWPTAQPAYNGGGYAPFKVCLFICCLTCLFRL